MEDKFSKLYNEISDVLFTVRNGIANTAVPQRFVEMAKNVLFNNMDDIEAALKFASEASKQIEVLELELNDAERELNELSKKTTQRKKAKPADE